MIRITVRVRSNGNSLDCIASERPGASSEPGLIKALGPGIGR